MNIKIILLAIMGLIGTYFLEFSFFNSFLTFNVILWSGIAYSLIIKDEETIVKEILTEIRPSPPNSTQIEFERFLLRKYTEISSTEREILNREIQIAEESNVSILEN
ncbi:MAG: hypothetical protein ACXAAH_09650 [Promethearchaeota archaeon]|jgi:hypothetical protein